MVQIRTAENLLECNRPEINELILKEFGKSEADIRDYVNIVKEWTNSQLHLPESPSEKLIEQFLIFNKFSVEEVKRKLDMYYTVRTLMPEFYQNKHPLSPEMVQQSDQIHFVVLPKLDPNHCRVGYLKYNEACIAETMDLDNLMAHVLNRIELFLLNHVVLDTILIYDLQHYTSAHFVRIDIMYLKKMIFIIRATHKTHITHPQRNVLHNDLNQAMNNNPLISTKRHGTTIDPVINVYSAKVRAVHFINSQMFINMWMSTLKTLLPKKLAERVYFHKNLETLFQMVPKEICPEEIGGNEVSLQKLDALWQENFKKYKDRFDQLENMRVNEELRPAPLVNSDLLGYHGNFKKLDVD